MIMSWNTLPVEIQEAILAIVLDDITNPYLDFPWKNITTPTRFFKFQLHQIIHALGATCCRRQLKIIETRLKNQIQDFSTAKKELNSQAAHCSAAGSSRLPDHHSHCVDICLQLNILRLLRSRVQEALVHTTTPPDSSTTIFRE